MAVGSSNARLRDELTAPIVPMGVLNLIATAFGPVMFLMAAGDRIDQSAGRVWLVALWVLGVIQGFILGFNRKWRKRSISGWINSYAALEAINGATWGAAILITPMPGEEFAMSTLVFALLAITTSACVVAFAGSRLIGRSFLWSQWGVYIGFGFLLGNDLGLILGGVVSCFVTSLYLEYTHRTLAEAVGGRIRSAELADELSFLASTDSLTGLKNRSAFVAGLQTMLDSSTPAVLFIDLDGFKAINDQFGHGRGDDVLKQVAQRLLDVTRETDLVGRLGGDEFVIAVSDRPEEKIVTLLAERLVASIAEPYEGTPTVRVTASVGVAEAWSATDAENILKRADLAMYQVKGNGGGSHQTYEEIILD